MVGGIRNKIMSLFKTNTTEKNSKPTPISNVYRDRKKTRKQTEDKIKQSATT